MPQTTKAVQLAQTIRSNLLGVLPMDQEIQLEDADWKLILDALEFKDTSTPAPRAIVFTRVTRQRPDGTFETRERSGYARKPAAPEPDLSTPMPSCDAPSCDCAEGEDCEANGAAEKVGQSYEDFDRAIKEEQLKLLRAKADGLKPHPRQLVVTINGNDVQIQESGPDWHLRTAIAHRELLADTAAAIAIQGKRLDMLLKRLPDPDTHMVRVVMPTEVHREGDVETWILDPAFQGHDAQFAMGDALTDSSAYHGIFQVLSVGQRFVDKKISLRVKRHPGFVFDREAF